MLRVPIQHHTGTLRLARQILAEDVHLRQDILNDKRNVEICRGMTTEQRGHASTGDTRLARYSSRRYSRGNPVCKKTPRSLGLYSRRTHGNPLKHMLPCYHALLATLHGESTRSPSLGTRWGKETVQTALVRALAAGITSVALPSFPWGAAVAAYNPPSTTGRHSTEMGRSAARRDTWQGEGWVTCVY